MDLKPHGYRVGAHDAWFEDAAVPLPRNGVDDDNTTPFVATARRVIEPWLSAVFQSEHLNLLGKRPAKAVFPLSDASV